MIDCTGMGENSPVPVYFFNRNLQNPENMLEYRMSSTDGRADYGEESPGFTGQGAG